MIDVRSQLGSAVRSALDAMGVPAEVEAGLEPSSKPEFGDWSTPAPLRAARGLRRPPLVIAAELRERLTAAGVPLVREWTLSPPGYVNAHLDDPHWAAAVIGEAVGLDPAVPLVLPSPYQVAEGKTLIEHTNINTNKAAHVGHLRNACLGDAVARILRRAGEEVEVNNYIDDTGSQVADVVVGTRELGITQAEGEPFDQFCSRVYVEVSRRYEVRPELRARRQATLHAIEAGDPGVAPYVKDLARRVVRAHLATMRRFGIGYDLLTWESDIIRLGFWQQAFDLLRQAGDVALVPSGKNEGCWVLPAPGDTGDHAVNSDEAKVLVKSDGVATYTAKDIAYQLWKFGLLGRDFGYAPWDPDDPGGPSTTTAEVASTDTPPAHFGRARRVINVIDVRQAYLQNVVKQALAQLGHQREADNSIHLAYEVVALSPAAARVLGLEVADGRGVQAFSGRRGIEVRADDLLDRATEKIAERTSDPETARSVAAGAVRYYLQKFSLSQIIAFDFDEALRTTGDTGVYLQYAHARAAGILRKVPESSSPEVNPAQLSPSERALIQTIDGYRRALAEAATNFAPGLLATYAFSLATALSDFYERTPAIVREPDPAVRGFRRRLVAATKATLGDVLTTLGIPAPEQI